MKNLKNLPNKPLQFQVGGLYYSNRFKCYGILNRTPYGYVVIKIDGSISWLGIQKTPEDMLKLLESDKINAFYKGKLTEILGVEQ